MVFTLIAANFAASTMFAASVANLDKKYAIYPILHIHCYTKAYLQRSSQWLSPVKNDEHISCRVQYITSRDYRKYFTDIHTKKSASNKQSRLQDWRLDELPNTDKLHYKPFTAKTKKDKTRTRYPWRGLRQGNTKVHYVLEQKHTRK